MWQAMTVEQRATLMRDGVLHRAEPVRRALSHHPRADRGRPHPAAAERADRARLSGAAAARPAGPRRAVGTGAAHRRARHRPGRAGDPGEGRRSSPVAAAGPGAATPDARRAPRPGWRVVLRGSSDSASEAELLLGPPAGHLAVLRPEAARHRASSRRAPARMAPPSAAVTPSSRAASATTSRTLRGFVIHQIEDACATRAVLPHRRQHRAHDVVAMDAAERVTRLADAPCGARAQVVERRCGRARRCPPSRNTSTARRSANRRQASSASSRRRPRSDGRRGRRYPHRPNRRRDRHRRRWSRDSRSSAGPAPRRWHRHGAPAPDRPTRPAARCSADASPAPPPRRRRQTRCRRRCRARGTHDSEAGCGGGPRDRRRRHSPTRTPAGARQPRPQGSRSRDGSWVLITCCLWPWSHPIPLQSCFVMPPDHQGKRFMFEAYHGVTAGQHQANFNHLSARAIG